MKSHLDSPMEPFLHEQLALRRLKELWAPVVKAWRWPLAALLLPIRGVELVRRVAPDRPPLLRVEWEKPDWTRPNIY